MSFCFWVFLCMVMKQKEIKFKPRIKLNHNKYIIHIIPATYLYTFQNHEFNALQYTSETFSIIHTYLVLVYLFPCLWPFPIFFIQIYRLAIFGSLSKGVFEQRSSTGGVLFAFFGNGFVHIFE